MSSIIVNVRAKPKEDLHLFQSTLAKIKAVLKEGAFHFVEEQQILSSPVEQCNTSFLLVLPPSECGRLRSMMQFHVRGDFMLLQADTIVGLHLASDITKTPKIEQKATTTASVGLQTEVQTAVKNVQTDEVKTRNKYAATDEEPQKVPVGTMTECLAAVKVEQKELEVVFESLNVPNEDQATVKNEVLAPIPEVLAVPLEAIKKEVEQAAEDVSAAVKEDTNKNNLRRKADTNISPTWATVKKMKTEREVVKAKRSEPKRTLKCKLCKASVDINPNDEVEGFDNVYLHILEKHVDMNRYKCKREGRTFQDPRRARKHMKSHDVVKNPNDMFDDTVDKAFIGRVAEFSETTFGEFFDLDSPKVSISAVIRGISRRAMRSAFPRIQPAKAPQN